MTAAARLDLDRLLQRAPARHMERRLVRCVPQLAFSRRRLPSFLYTSGRPNRCNPAGVDCLYFSETEATAEAEYRATWRGLPAEHQPRLTYTARVHLRAVLDLGDRKVVDALCLSAADWEASWRLARVPTRLQEIGRAPANHRGSPPGSVPPARRDRPPRSNRYGHASERPRKGSGARRQHPAG